jgi:hypothetical protein
VYCTTARNTYVPTPEGRARLHPLTLTYEVLVTDCGDPDASHPEYGANACSRPAVRT